ncbi:unnamed protein product [Adineta ricciae]|uniref:Uncharacterized protein n=1 Tax=Adineta ricciae TaxID=249248 RepID=A0A815PWM5_ADIRI|nr:unnamed protein product [Adineta ricciae]
MLLKLCRKPYLPTRLAAQPRVDLDYNCISDTSTWKCSSEKASNIMISQEQVLMCLDTRTKMIIVIIGTVVLCIIGMAICLSCCSLRREAEKQADFVCTAFVQDSQ